MNMWNGPYGPPPPFFPYTMGRTGLTLDELEETEAQIKRLKKHFKEEEGDSSKKKDPKWHRKQFGILETTGLLMMLSVPVVLTQLHLLNIVKEALKNSLN